MEPQEKPPGGVDNWQAGVGALLGVTGNTTINAGLGDKLSMSTQTQLISESLYNSIGSPEPEGMTGKMCPLAPELWSPLRSYMPGERKGTFRSPSPPPCQLINWAVKGLGGLEVWSGHQANSSEHHGKYLEELGGDPTKSPMLILPLWVQREAGAKEGEGK